MGVSATGISWGSNWPSCDCHLPSSDPLTSAADLWQCPTSINVDVPSGTKGSQLGDNQSPSASAGAERRRDET